jgi:hypothetical protein
MFVLNEEETLDHYYHCAGFKYYLRFTNKAFSQEVVQLGGQILKLAPWHGNGNSLSLLRHNELPGSF